MRAVFFDRDGTLNEAIVREGRPFPPESQDELRILADAPAALSRLKQAGFLIIVVTNQPDVARGGQSRGAVESIHAALAAELPIDDFLVCWHDDGDGCACRKPKPGLLLEAAARHEIDLRASFLVGDRWRDINAGAAAGCRTILIDRRYRERGPSVEPDFRALSLDEAAAWILKTD